MNKEVMDKIQYASQKFREAIEEATGIKKTFISWAVLERNGQLINHYSGITIGEELKQEDLAQTLLQINGRSWTMQKNPPPIN
jgi:hypothetical protein